MIRGRLTIAGLVLVSAMTGWAVSGAAPVREGRTVWWAPAFEYDHKQMEVQLSGKDGRQAWIDQGGARIQAERIFWNRRTRIGRCYENVTILDVTNETVITGGEAWHYSDESHSVVRVNPKMHMKKDDITVFADEMHRFGKDALAEARGNVRIETRDGTAWGDKAVYHQKRGELILSGDPWLEQKTNTHRANEIIFFRNDNKVVLRGQAKLMQGRDHVRAGYIEIIDLDGTNSKATNHQTGPTSGSSSTNRKNRLAFFRDDVRIFRYTKKNELESVTVGEEGEFYERRGYVRLTGSPRLVMVSDNTITSGAVMEQYRDEDLAIIKGNAYILRGYRTVNAQLIRYDTKSKMAELAGNPVITEYGDSYRADYVTYDTSKDIISWRGSTMAVVGTAAQAKKESDWSSKNNAAVFTLSGNANGANVIKVVGDVWLSTSGRPSTNRGQVSWGKRADEADAIPRGTHIVIADTWSWVDLLGRDGLMLRLRGPAHMVLASSEWETATQATNSQGVAGRASSAAATRQGSASSQASAARGAALSPKPRTAAGSSSGEQGSSAGSAASAGSGPATLSLLTNMRIAPEITNSSAGQSSAGTTAPLVRSGTNRVQADGVAETNTVKGPGRGEGGRAPRRLGRSAWVLRRGTVLARPGPAARLDLVSGVFSCSNLQVPFVAESETNGGVRLVVLSNQPALSARISLPSLGLVTFRSNSEVQDFRKRNDPILTQPLVFERPLVVRSENVHNLDRILEVRLTNELHLAALALSNMAASNTNSGTGSRPDESVLTNRMLFLRPQRDLLEMFCLGLSNVAATNTPGQPVVFAPESRAKAGVSFQARLFWAGVIGAWISDALGGQEFWKTLQLPKKQTDYGELIDEARNLSIVWGAQPAKRPESGRAGGGQR